MTNDPTQPSKAFHDEAEKSDEDSTHKHWVPEFISPFYRFFQAFTAYYQIKDIGAAAVQKVVKNRKKFPGRRIGPLLHRHSQQQDFAEVFELLDAVKG